MTEKVRVEDIAPHIMGVLFRHDHPSIQDRYYPTNIFTGDRCKKMFPPKDRRKVTTNYVLLFVARLLNKYGVEIDKETPLMTQFEKQGVFK